MNYILQKDFLHTDEFSGQIFYKDSEVEPTEFESYRFGNGVQVSKRIVENNPEWFKKKAKDPYVYSIWTDHGYNEIKYTLGHSEKVGKITRQRLAEILIAEEQSKI